MPDDAARSAESSSRGGTGFVPVILVLVFVLLPVLYVLSVGPAEYLLVNDHVDSEIVRAFYWPLAWLYQSWEPIQPLFDWYMDFWR